MSFEPVAEAARAESATADRISVMRDGRNAGELSRADASYDKIVALMVGRELSGVYFPTKTEKEPARSC